MDTFFARGGLWVVAQAGFITAIALARGRPFEPTSPGTPILAAGAVLLLSAAANLGRSLSPLPEPAEGGEHVERGWYRLIRHPIYSGLLLGSAGFAVATQSWDRFLLTVAFAVMIDAKARNEERRLAKRYPTYEAYAHRTKRFIPWVY
jgi:protein-S-isoprenylcysteine O-methyltransferase Ste14